MNSLRLVLVEDSVLLREGLLRLFGEAGFVTLGSFERAEPALAALKGEQPDMVVLDVRLPPGFRDEGVRAALQIRREYPRVGVLLLSQYVELTYARELLAGGTGGVGYLLKDRLSSFDEFREAVIRVAAGGTALDPQVVSELLAANADPLTRLTPREREVLELMAQGLTNAGIAESLWIGTGAVEKNISSIFAKLGLEDNGSDHRRVLAVLAYLRH